MTADEVRIHIVEFLRHHGVERDIVDETDLLRDVHLDSIDFIELVSQLEDELDLEVDFSDVDPDELTRVGGLIRLVLGASNA